MTGTRLRRSATLLLLLSCATPSAAVELKHIAERGPATLLVGAIFTASAPLAGSATLLSGGNPRLQGCRLLHGAKMLVAGAVLLPAGILASPFNPTGAAVGWVDALPDAFQEDYCTRPAGSVMP